MLRDKVKNYDELITVNGSCRFCGQMMTVEVPDSWNEEMINELVVEKCECNDAVGYTGLKRRKERAHEKIRILFGDGAAVPVDDKAEKLLHMAADAALEWDIEKITVDIKDGTKGNIKRNAKGNIKIERSESSKNAYEL